MAGSDQQFPPRLQDGPDSVTTHPGSCIKWWGWGWIQAGLPDHLQWWGNAGTCGCSSLLFLHKINPPQLVNALFCSRSVGITFCGDIAFPPARHPICAIAATYHFFSIQNRPKQNQSADRNVYFGSKSNTFE